MAAKQTSKLDIYEWDINNFKINTVTMLVGRRGTGKSTILQELCYHLRHQIDYVVGFSPTEEVNEDLFNIIPRSMVYNEIDIPKIQELISLQKRTWKIKPSYHLLLLFDDCGYDKKKFRNKTIGDLFKNGRHYKITVIFTMQYAKDIGPDLRGQIDYLFACQDAGIDSRAILHKQFFGQFRKFKDFAFTMDRCTENYECIVNDSKTSKNNKIQNQVFFFKARLSLRQLKKNNPNYVPPPRASPTERLPYIPDYRFGAKWLWKINKVRFVEETFDYPELPEYRNKSSKKKNVDITHVQKHDVKGKKLKD